MFNFKTTYTQLNDCFYSFCEPTSVKKPLLILFNDALAKKLNLDHASLNKNDIASLLSGNTLLKGHKPLSQACAGHQFGHFTHLGDGRAHLLGEHLTKQNKRVDIQLKGSGQSPYSRRGDGRAALGPMLREYIISEAMHALKIPTTRSLAVVTTGERVYRESAVDGAILTRVAGSHIRFGTFEYAASRQERSLLEDLLRYTINRHNPKLNESKNPALSLLETLMHQHIDLIVHWMRVGFIHGVMNTDNMSLASETIDYGPCAFMTCYML